MIQNLKKLIVKLSMTGTIEVVEQPFQLYKDSYGFVLIRCLVPVTPNTTKSSVCTVHSIAIDERGITREGDEKYPLNYAGRAVIDGYEYKVYENPMPYEFTKIVGSLDIIFNYMDTDGEGNAISLLASGTYSTTVSRGGASKGTVPLSEPDVTLAKVNATLELVERIETDVDALMQPPDDSEANLVGVASVTLTDDGRLKFSYLKGEKGDNGVVQWGVNAPTVLSTIEWGYNKN